jgi:hypothetical protein
MLYLSHGKAKEKKRKKKKRKGRSRVHGHLAFGKGKLKKRRDRPRVPGHLTLGEGKIKKKDRGLPRVPGHLALGEEVKKTNFFPECCTRGRVKKIRSTALNLPRVLPWHSGKPSPSVRFLALGEDLFPVSRFPGSSSPSVALGEGFPECLRHSGKPVAPVVNDGEDANVESMDGEGNIV